MTFAQLHKFLNANGLYLQAVKRGPVYIVTLHKGSQVVASGSDDNLELAIREAVGFYKRGRF